MATIRFTCGKWSVCLHECLHIVAIIDFTLHTLELHFVIFLDHLFQDHQMEAQKFCSKKILLKFYTKINLKMKRWSVIMWGHYKNTTNYFYYNESFCLIELAFHLTPLLIRLLSRDDESANGRKQYFWKESHQNEWIELHPSWRVYLPLANKPNYGCQRKVSSMEANNKNTRNVLAQGYMAQISLSFRKRWNIILQPKKCLCFVVAVVAQTVPYSAQRKVKTHKKVLIRK